MRRGCDPDELERLVPRCRALATALRRVQVGLGRMDRGAWSGPGSRRWWRFVDHELVPLLRGVAVDLDRLVARLRRQADEQRRASLPPASTTTVRSSTSGDGRWVGRTGAPGATIAVLLVPGVGTTAADRGAMTEDAQRVWSELAVRAQRSDRSTIVGAEGVVVVSWLGYDAPDGVVAGIDRRAADDGGRLLAAELAVMRAAGVRRVVVVGHSYGGLVATSAAARGADVDEVVLLGAPGLGAGLDLDELQLGPGVDLWTATESLDPVAGIGRLGVVHGPDPTRRSRALQTSRRGHSSYLDDPVLLGALAELALQ